MKRFILSIFLLSSVHVFGQSMRAENGSSIEFARDTLAIDGSVYLLGRERTFEANMSGASTEHVVSVAPDLMPCLLSLVYIKRQLVKVTVYIDERREDYIITSR